MLSALGSWFIISVVSFFFNIPEAIFHFQEKMIKFSAMVSSDYIIVNNTYNYQNFWNCF